MAKQVVNRGKVPSPWKQLNTHLVLWHGCTDSDAKNIESNGIDLTRSRNALDFGRGLYTTTRSIQAEGWAQRKYSNLSSADRASARLAVLRFRVPLNQLARLESLMFVRGDSGHHEFWSFVHHCRRSIATTPRTHLYPARKPPDDWYDLVCGPLAAVWPPSGREVIPESDQFSFHTPAGIAILNDVINVGSPVFAIKVL